MHTPVPADGFVFEGWTGDFTPVDGEIISVELRFVTMIFANFGTAAIEPGKSNGID